MFNLTAKPVSAQAAGGDLRLPTPTCVFDLVEINGVQTLVSTISSPIDPSVLTPEIVKAFQTTRFGKITYQTDAKGEYVLDGEGKKIIKEDNSAKVSSVLTLLSLIEDVSINFPIKDAEGKQVVGEDGQPQFAALADEESGTQFIFRGAVQGRMVNKDVPASGE